MPSLLHRNAICVPTWLIACALPSFAQTDWRVSASAAPGGDGQSWASAFDTLQGALDVAQSGDSIWVTAGTYYPSNRKSPSNPRSARFLIDQVIKLYGGFEGHESSVAERNPELYERTLLSADIGVAGDISDNAYRVLELPGFSDPGVALLDGFRITGGNAIGYGGAVLAKLQMGGFNPRITIANSTIHDNFAERGGAISVENFGVVNLKNCVVRNNTANTQGGAIYSFTGGCRAVNTRFSDNVALTIGGVILADSSDFGWNLFTNCIFDNNRANRGGVGYLKGGDFYSGICAWFQCTMVGNEGLVSGGAIHVVTDTAVPGVAGVYNSILWDNLSPDSPAIFGTGLDVRSCDVQGGYPGAGNINVNPLFTLDFRTRLGSPVNDAGNHNLVASDFLDLDKDGDVSEFVPYDFRGYPRQMDDQHAPDTGIGGAPLVDLGAIEARRSERIR